MQNVAEVLKTAIELEHRGREFYMDAAGRADDPVVRAVLTALAHDEESHERVIRSFYQALERTEGWPEVPADIASSPARERVAEIARQTAGRIGPDATYTSVYETARDMEQKSYDFYGSNADEAEDTDVAKFLRFLATVENTHLEMLDVLLESVRQSAEGETS
jgi:rubrerythrin